MFSGALTGWRAPKFLRNLSNSAAASVYRIPNITLVNGIETFDNDITAASTWLEFEDINTNVVRSQVVNDQYQRYYFASPSVIPEYNTLARIQAGQPPWQLGVPAPGCAPTVTVSGGGNSFQLGNTATDGNADPVNANTIYLFPIVPTGACTVQDVQWMPSTTDATVQFAAVVYEDQNDGGNTPTAPGSLLGYGTVITGITSGTLADSQFVNPPALLANTPYWIGIMLSTGTNSPNANYAQEAGTNTNSTVSFSNTFSNGPMGFAPAVSTGLPDLYMYADLQSSANIEGRSYVYTWVSAYGEEGPPSPYTLVNGWANGTWTIGLYTPPSNQMGNGGIMNLAVLRLYRTVTGSTGTANYFFVADISLGSTDPDAIAFVAQDTGCLPPAETFADNIADNVVALNLQMPSTNYFPPPNNLQGILALPNGMYVGWVNNQVWLSAPYYPHAWPPGNVYTTDFPIVGLGFTLGTIVACTSANAWILTGTSPSSMSVQKCAPPDPCLSRGSILSTDAGVYYQSPNGLIQVTNTGQSSNATELWITREKWAQLTPQKYLRAMPLASCYFAFGSVQNGDDSVAQQGFNIELDQDNTSFTIWPQPGGHRVGFNLMAAPNVTDVTNIQVDPWTAFGMIIQGGALYYWDFQDPAPAMMPYDYTTKTFQQNTKRNFEAMRCWFQIPSGTSYPTNPRNTLPPTDPSWQTLRSDALAFILVYADIQQEGQNTGQFTLVTAREVRRSGELLRLAGGFKAENWYFRILGQVPISNIQVATSVKELANV